MELLLFVIPFLLIPSLYGQSSSPELILNPAGIIEPKEGERELVTCQLNDSVPGADSAVYEWEDKDGNLVTDTGRIRTLMLGDLFGLAIDDIVSDDSGVYTCRSGQYESSFRLEVKKQLAFVNCEVNQYGEIGKEAKILCQADSSNANSWWEKKGTPIDLSDATKYIIEADGLRILELAPEEDGVYVYNARLQDPRTLEWDWEIETITFKAVVAPKIKQPIGGTVAYVGEEHKLYCSATGDPLPDIQWYKADTTTPLETGDRYEVKQTRKSDTEKEGELIFNPVTREDEDEYTCKAVAPGVILNDKSSLEAEDVAKMNVYIRPYIDDIPDTEGKEGQGVAIVCVAHGLPMVDVVWENVETNVRYTSQDDGQGPLVTVREIADSNSKEVTLQFRTLKSSDAGTYRCVARNIGGDASKEVKLSVIYKPIFDDTETGPYYTWTGNQNSFVPCTAMANPEPTFVWKKDGKEILINDPDYTITHEDNPSNPLKPTSKLLVKYTGSNVYVFGEYECEATNKAGRSNKSILIQEGKRPGQAIVTAPEISAKRILFLVTEPTVLGPAVTQYKFKFTYPNGTVFDRNFAKEVRGFTDDKSSNPRTKIEIFGLTPSTSYSFSVQAINPVGLGPERILDLTTVPITVPSDVRILNGPTNPDPTVLMVRWEVPNDGGDDIMEYKLSHQEVNVQNTNGSLRPNEEYKLLSPKPGKVEIDKIATTYYRIQNLRPGRFYMITVQARNSEGWGLPGTTIIKMQEVVGGLSTGAIIGILIAVFFILFIVVDVFCYFKSNCGVIMTIREALGGGRGDEGYSAAKTDDVENLAKKDELTEEAKAAEENEMIDGQVNDEKKEPLLSSEEQKVDTVDEVDKSPEKVMEPEEKEEIKPETDTKTEEAPASTEEKTESAPEQTDEKPSEPSQD